MAAALVARIDDQLARSATRAARARDREKSLLVTHLPASAASGAIDRCFPRRHPAAIAFVALFLAADLHLLGDAEDCFLEFQRQVLAQIGAALGAGATSTSLAAKHVTEDVAEDVLKVDGIEAAKARASCVAYTCVAEAIVACALLAVGKNGVCLAAFLEALFRLRIIGIAVRMVLQRQLAIGALDFLVDGGARDAQDLVVITFHCGGQNW